MRLSEPEPKGDLAERWPGWSSAEGVARRAAARRKRALYEESHLGLVHDRIAHRLQNPGLARDVGLFASRSPNIFKSVVDAVAVAYGKGVQRDLRGLGAPVVKAFAEIVDESGIGASANGISARAWGIGPTMVSPHVDTRNRLALDVLTPDDYDVRLEGRYVEAVLWRAGATWIELDHRGWGYFNEAGEPERPFVPHAVGLCPAVPFVAVDQTGDWFCSNEHMGLCDATLDAAYKWALSLYNRQTSGNKLVVIQGDIEGTPPGQSLGSPVQPLYLRGAPAQTDVKVIDRQISAADGLAEVRAIIEMAVSVYGISPSEVSGSGDWGQLGVSIRSDKLGALRDKQVGFLRNSEVELWAVVCDLIRGSSHRHARVLPPGDEIRSAIRVSFPDLAPPDDAIKRIEAMEAGLRYGLCSPADWLLQARPELTRAEAEELLQANLKVYLDTVEPLVNRNLPAVPPEALGVRTTPQIQGRIGGQISGEMRRNEA